MNDRASVFPVRLERWNQTRLWNLIHQGWTVHHGHDLRSASRHCLEAFRALPVRDNDQIGPAEIPHHSSYRPATYLALGVAGYVEILVEMNYSYGGVPS